MGLADWLTMAAALSKQNGAGEMDQSRFDELLADARSRYDWVK